MAEFCQARGLRFGQFYAWRRRLWERAKGGFVEVAVVAAEPGGGFGRRSRSFQAKRVGAVRWTPTTLLLKFVFAAGSTFEWRLDSTAITLVYLKIRLRVRRGYSTLAPTRGLLRFLRFSS